MAKNNANFLKRRDEMNRQARATWWACKVSKHGFHTVLQWMLEKAPIARIDNGISINTLGGLLKGDLVGINSQQATKLKNALRFSGEINPYKNRNKAKNNKNSNKQDKKGAKMAGKIRVTTKATAGLAVDLSATFRDTILTLVRENNGVALLGTTIANRLGLPAAMVEHFLSGLVTDKLLTKSGENGTSAYALYVAPKQQEMKPEAPEKRAEKATDGKLALLVETQNEKIAEMGTTIAKLTDQAVYLTGEVAALRTLVQKLASAWGVPV